MIARGIFNVGLWAPEEPEGLAGEPFHDGELLKERALPLSDHLFGSAEVDGRRRAGRPVISRRPFHGRHLYSAPTKGPHLDLAWDATLKAVAHLQSLRHHSGGLAFQLRPNELLRKIRFHRPGRLLLLVVDISGSMGSRLMALAQRLAQDLLKGAYQKRDRIAMVAFRDHSAELLYPPTNQVELIRRSMSNLTLGGTTPLAQGLECAHRSFKQAMAREAYQETIMVLISDGRSNTSQNTGFQSMHEELEFQARKLAAEATMKILFLDTTEAGKEDRPAARLARWLQAERLQLWRQSRPPLVLPP